VLLARVIKNALGGGGFTGIDVGDDSDIADVAQGRCTGHCKLPLKFRGLDRGNPGPRSFRAANGSEKRGEMLGEVQELNWPRKTQQFHGFEPELLFGARHS
jgi:hypothetical protein